MTQNEVDAYCESVKYSPLRAGGRRKPKYGVGINDLPHITQFKDGEGKVRVHSGYDAWSGVLTRCYCGKYRSKNLTYRDVEICEEWLRASNFVEWQKTQYREQGWQLDKDLLVVGNSLYSPETCLYVPSWLNSFVTASDALRGKYMIGVAWHKRDEVYIAQCNNPITGQRGHVGYFKSELEAHLAWRKRKLEIALELKPRMDEIDLRIYPNVLSIITNAR